MSDSAGQEVRKTPNSAASQTEKDRQPFPSHRLKDQFELEGQLERNFFDGSDLNNELKQVNLSTLSNNYAVRCNQLHPLKEEELLKCCLVGNHNYSNHSSQTD